jgi:hypothetical protein
MTFTTTTCFNQNISHFKIEIDVKIHLLTKRLSVRKAFSTLTSLQIF